MLKNNIPTSLVPIQNQGIAKVEKSIHITNKLIFNGIEPLFNEAFLLLNSEQNLSKESNYLFLFEYDSNKFKLRDFRFKSRSPDDIVKSIWLIDKILTNNENHKFSYFLRGVAREKLEHFKDANLNYSKAIEIDPKFSDAYFCRANVKHILQDYFEAVKDYNKAIELNPNDSDAYFNRAISKFELCNFESAIDDHNIAIELRPEFSDAFFNRAITKNELCNYESAIEDYNKYIELVPGDSQAYFQRAQIKEYLNDKIGALEDYNICIELDSEDEYVYFSRAEIKFELHDYLSALEDYRKAYKSFPSLCSKAIKLIEKKINYNAN